MKDQVWLVTELMALRLLVQRLLVQRADQNGGPAWLEAERAELRRLTEIRVPGADWAMSEALAGELQDKVDEMLDRALEALRSHQRASASRP